MIADDRIVRRAPEYAFSDPDGGLCRPIDAESLEGSPANGIDIFGVGARQGGVGLHGIVYRACDRDLDQTRLRVFAHDRRAIGQGARCLAERRCGAGVVAEMITGLAEAGMNGGSRGAARDGSSQQSCSLVEAPLLGVEQPQSGSGFRQLGLQLQRIAEGALGGGHVLALIVQAGEIEPDVQLQRIELH